MWWLIIPLLASLLIAETDRQKAEEKNADQARQTQTEQVNK